jgi:outer membrane protein OmpA-like peptidoglycan-associated protein
VNFMFRKRPIVTTLLSLMISAAPATILADAKSDSECLPFPATEQFQLPEWVKQRRAEMEKMRERFAVHRNGMMARQMQPMMPADFPDWVVERREQMAKAPQVPEFAQPQVPDWVIERREQMAKAPQMPEFAQRQIPDWVVARRQQMPEWMVQRRPGPMVGYPIHHFGPFYRHPYPYNGWRGSDWGPFDGMGDMFGDMDMSFNISMRGSGNGYADGRGYHGYGYPHPAWPAPTAYELIKPKAEAVTAVEQNQPFTVDSALGEAASGESSAVVEVSLVDDMDSDGDGVLDSADICPDSVADAEVDGLGCEQTVAIVLRGVNFKTDSDELTDTSTEILDRVANTLIANPTVVVEIAGHTDSDADEAYNKDLSQRRAETVMAYLTDKGVIADNLSAMGYGETQPIASNETSEGKAQNRRVELVRSQ